MNNIKPLSAPFRLLWLIALATVIVVCLLQSIASRLSAIQQQQTNEQLLTQILANVPHDNDLLMDAILLDPAATTFAQHDLLGLTAPRTAYVAKQQGKITALVLPAITLAGYNGGIELLLGISVDGEITGVRIVAHNETPRLGDKIELAFSNWVFNFNKRSLGNTDAQLWRVKQDGGEFDQFTGATITPRAVVGAVKNALEFFAANKNVLLTVQSAGVPAHTTPKQLIANAGVTAWLVAMMQPLPLFLLGLLLALKRLLAPTPPVLPPPPADSAPGSKRVRVTGKA